MQTATSSSSWIDDGITIPPPPRPVGVDLAAAIQAAAQSKALHQLGRVWFFTVQAGGAA